MKKDSYNNLSVASSIAAQSITAATDGTSVDLANFESVLLVIDTGTITGTTPTATLAIQESSDNLTFTAVAAADLIGGALPASIDTTNDATVYKRGYIGTKRFVRVACTAVSGTTPTLPMSAVVVRGNARKAPVS